MISPGIAGYSIALGVSGGVLGLAYLGATGAVTDAIFEGESTSWWSGEWWWVPVIAVGALAVAALRHVWAVPEHVPGGVESIESAEVDHRSAPRWVIIAAVSAVAGASLGPSFALVLMGGGLGSWIAERRWAEGKADRDYTLTGIAGGFGGAFTAPILGAFMVSELAPTRRTRYVAAIIPQLLAAHTALAGEQRFAAGRIAGAEDKADGGMIVADDHAEDNDS